MTTDKTEPKSCCGYSHTCWDGLVCQGVCDDLRDCTLREVHQLLNRELYEVSPEHRVGVQLAQSVIAGLREVNGFERPSDAP